MTEPMIRLAAFAGIFAVMAALELVIPRRRLAVSKPRRWVTNVAIAGLDSLLVRLMALFVIPLAAAATADWATGAGVGLFNWLSWAPWLEWLLAIILLDLAIYGQHVVSHKLPILWRLHKVHHTDRDFDVTTAVRFHPVEIGLSMLWKILVVLAIGPAAFAVVLFEIILNGCAMFNHANVHLPKGLDRALRLVVVTPDMHRVHHSVHRHEHNMNYGFNLSIWDRLFGTYRPQPGDSHEGMTIGLPGYQSEAPTRLIWSLGLPFRDKTERGSAQPADQNTLSGK